MLSGQLCRSILVGASRARARERAILRIVIDAMKWRKGGESAPLLSAAAALTPLLVLTIPRVFYVDIFCSWVKALVLHLLL